MGHASGGRAALLGAVLLVTTPSWGQATTPGSATATPSETQSAQPAQLRLVAPLREIAVDAKGVGSTLLELTHDGSDVIELPLRGGELVNTATKRTLVAELSFGDVMSEKGVLAYTLKLDPKKTQPVRVFVSGIAEAGEFRAPLFIDGKPLFEVNARRVEVPFSLTLRRAGSETAPIPVSLGKTLELGIVNGDALTHEVSWRFLVDGVLLAKSERSIKLEPFRSEKAAIELGEDLYVNCFFGLFRTTLLRGTLEVAYVGGAALDPGPRSLPVVVELARQSPTTRSFLGTVFAFFVLAVGGVASLFVNHWVPNASRRVALRKQLEPLASRTKFLSDHVSGSLRTQLRVCRLQLSQRIDKELAFLPGAGDVFEAGVREAAVLERRVDLVARIDERLRLIDKMGSDGPPGLLRKQARRLEHALRPLVPGKVEDATFNAIEQLLTQVDTEIERIERADPALREAAITEAKALWEKFKDNWYALRDKSDPAVWEAMLAQQAGPFLLHAEACLGKEVEDSETLSSIDTAYTKLVLIGEYVRVCEIATPEQAQLFDEFDLDEERFPPAERRTQRQRFFQCLSGAGSRTLEQARLILREAEQGIFVRQVVDQIQLGRFRIHAEPKLVAPFEPVRFRFVFREEKFNDAAAREQLECTWLFPHDRGITNEEHCWSPTQFFSSADPPQPRTVTVRIGRGEEQYAPTEGRGLDAGVLERLDHVEVRVRSPKTKLRQRTVLEFVQLSLALAVTMGALVAGARDQLAKLDILPAFVTVFALGFGADVVKNILGRRSANGSATTP
jgi:hypothetical protein